MRLSTVRSRRNVAIVCAVVAVATACNGIDAPTTKDITAFSFLAANNPDLKGDVTATISGTDITASVRFGQSVVGGLIATFSTTGADVSVGGVAQINSITANTYTSPAIYRVTAADGSTQDYTVTIATPSLLPKVDFTTEQGPGSIAIGDFNGDGKPDLAVSNAGSDTISVLRDATPSGATMATFAAELSLATGTATNPQSVAAGDLNGDGKPDLVVADGESNAISVFLNTTATGAATLEFAARADFATAMAPTIPVFVAIGDLNGDGKPDLAVANVNAPAGGAEVVSLFLNTTATGATIPSFAARVDLQIATNATSMTGGGISCVAIGDLNGDGKPDLVVTNGPLAVFLNTTATGAMTPTFSTRVDFATGSQPVFVAIGDLNGDGKPDLAAVNSGSIVSVFLNSTAAGAMTASFSPGRDFTESAPGYGPVSAAIGDLDGDGKPDLVVANPGTDTVSVLLNTTALGAMTPSLSAKIDFATGMHPEFVAVGDFNGDGKLDVAAADINAATVSVLLAQ